MRKDVIIGLTILFALTLLVSMSSAEILVGQPDSLYSVGDKFDLSVVLSPNANANDFFVASLNCGDKSVELYKNPVEVEAGKQKEIIVSTALKEAFIEDMKGECYVVVKYEGEAAESQKFMISDRVDVYLEINGVFFDPGKEMLVSGKATKANGDPLNGYVEVSINELNLSAYRAVSDGAFNFNFTVQDNAKSGNYQLKVNAYEKDSSGNVINSGNSSLIVRVRQVAQKEDIALSKESIIPGEGLVYTVVLTDQAGDRVQDDVALVISSPDGAAFLKKVMKSGESATLNTVYNYTPGYWKMEAKVRDLNIKKTFYIETLEKASFSVVNGTLIVTNLGNVLYNKPVQVSINDKNELLENLNVNVDGAKTVKLSAPAGEYSIFVNDGSQNVSLGKTVLTGNAVSFEQVFSGKYTIALWILVIVILAAIVFYFYWKTKKNKYFGKAPGKVSAPIKLMSASKGSGDKGPLVENGQRGEAVVVALRVGNMDDLEGESSNAPDTIRNALAKAKEAKGKIYSDGNYKTIVFSQITTKENDNNLRAVKLAKDIADMFSEHNKRFAQKIDFGVGVNSGEMIAETIGGNLKFTPIGNTIIAAKRIAEKAKGEVLLAGQVQRRVMGSVKCEKINGAEYGRVVNITDRQRHSGFIEGFMKRQDGKDFFGLKK